MYECIIVKSYCEADEILDEEGDLDGESDASDISVLNWLQKSARNERTIQIRAIDPPFAATVSVRSAPETNESTLFRVSERFLTFRSRSTNPFSATVSARSRSRNQRNDQLRTLCTSAAAT